MSQIQKSILMTGASGFIGQHLAPFLLDRGYNISSISRNTADSASIRWEELSVEVVNEVETVIHLAGIAHDIKRTANDEDYYQINYGLTKRLFDLFLQSNAKNFIYFSSIKAVSDGSSEQLYEESDMTPATAYGKSKKMAEEYLCKKSTDAKNVYILRPAMVHGPRNKGNLGLLIRFLQFSGYWPLAKFSK